jgi:tetratricopeptide (TPR) repeat protein
VVQAVRAKAASAPSPKEDPRFAQAVQNYEAAVKAMQEHKFDRAKVLLDKVIASEIRELADRARMHINICNQQLAKVSTSFKTPEEHYDYTVSLMNTGNYEAARAQLEKLAKQNPKIDYIVYGMASLEALTGHPEECLRYLGDAIRLNPANRFQARNDADFASMADDPRFTELLYPEPDAETAAVGNSGNHRY